MLIRPAQALIHAKCRQFLCCLTLLTLTLALRGAEPPSAATDGALRLPDMAVVATQSPRDATDLPWLLTVLNDEDWQLRLQAPTLPQAIARLPGILPQKTAIGMTSPYIRGFTGQRTVLVTDGIRLNNSFLRDGPNQYWNLVDPYFYDRLELLYGPASVLYGSDAIGGVLLAESAPLPRGQAESGLTWQGGELSLRYGSADQSWSEHLQGQVSVDDIWALRLGLTRQEFDDLRTGDDLDNPATSYDQWGGNLRLRYWITADDSLYFGYDQADQNDLNRTHATVAHQDYEGTLDKGGASDLKRLFDHDRHLAFARLERRHGDGWWRDLDLGIYYHYLLEDYQRIRSDGRQQLRQNRIETLGLDLRLVSPSNLGRWTYGLHGSHDRVHSQGQNLSAAGEVTELIQGDVADEASYDLLGAYVQNELPLSEDWEFISGLRYDYAALDADAVNFSGTQGTLKGHWDALTLSGRLLYHALPEQRLNLFAGVSQGFRAPNLSDTTRDGEFGGGVEVPTTDLKPEYYTTYELGAKTQARWGYAELVLYHTVIHDQIARLSLPTASKRNIDEGYVHGVEANLRWRVLDDWTVLGAIAWQEGEEETYLNNDTREGLVDRPLSRMLPLTGHLALRWQAEGSPLWLEGAAEMAKRQDKQSDNDEADNRFPPDGTPGYAVFHLRAGYQLTRKLDLSAALENVADTEYRIHGSGINEPGRQVVLGVRYLF